MKKSIVLTLKIMVLTICLVISSGVFSNPMTVLAAETEESTNSQYDISWLGEEGNGAFEKLEEQVKDTGNSAYRLFLAIGVVGLVLSIVIFGLSIVVSGGGNIGSKNITVKIKLSFPFSLFCHLFNSSCPIIHETALFPSFLPIKNAVIEPSIIPIKLYTIVLNAPKSATPASVLTTLGIGKITTCKYCNTIYNTGIHLPLVWRYSRNAVSSLTNAKKPVF